MVDLSSVMADPWHLDKKVPLGLIVTVLGGIASGIWFAGTATHRLDVLEKSDALTVQRLDASGSTQAITRERLARIEQQGSDNQDMLRRILDRLK